MMIKILIFAQIVFLFAGCTAIQQTRSPASVYDFGLPQEMHPQSSPQQPQWHRKSLLITDAAAPLWLDNTAIHYRLLYHNPAQTFTYADSRWIASPAVLLTQQLRNRIVSGRQDYVLKDSSSAKTDYVLLIELEEFTQLFDTLTDSRVAIGLRASLIERNSRKLIAQKDFSIKKKAPSGDAAGAVFALGSASHQVIDELIGWLAAAQPRD